MNSFNTFCCSFSTRRCAVLAGAAVALLALTTQAPAAEKFDAAAAVRFLAPFVEQDTIAVIRVDFSRLSVEPLVALLSCIAPNVIEARGNEHEDMRDDLAEQIAEVRRAGVTDAYVVVTLGGQSMIPQLLLIVPDGPRLDSSALRNAFNIHVSPRESHSKRELSERIGRQVGNAWVLPALSPVPPGAPVPGEFHPANRPELAEALSSVGVASIQIVLIPPASSRRVVEELMPKLPEQIGGGPSTVLTHGIRWAAVAIDIAPPPVPFLDPQGFKAPLGLEDPLSRDKPFHLVTNGAYTAVTLVDLLPHLRVRLTVKSQDDSAAEALRTKWLDVLKLAGQEMQIPQILPQFDKVVAILTPKLSGDRLTLAFDEKDIMALHCTVDNWREKTKQTQSAWNVRQIDVAMLNYESAFKHFPAAASHAPDGKPLLSWRVAILPYIDQEQLYKQFHLDEPWDSPHNKALIEKMPKLFNSPKSKAAKGLTNYLVPVGGGALCSSMSEEPQPKQITDGMSRTIMLVEVDDGHAVVWTKPDDLAFDPQDPSKGIGSLFEENFNVGFCDGSVRVIPKSIDPKTLKALFTRAGGEEIGKY